MIVIEEHTSRSGQYQIWHGERLFFVKLENSLFDYLTDSRTSHWHRFALLASWSRGLSEVWIFATTFFSGRWVFFDQGGVRLSWLYLIWSFQEDGANLWVENTLPISCPEKLNAHILRCGQTQSRIVATVQRLSIYFKLRETIWSSLKWQRNVWGTSLI